MRYDYKTIRTDRVEVRGIPCEFYDMRIDRATIPEGMFMYEVADGDSDGVPVRIRPGIMVNFYGSIVSNVKLVPDEGDTIWLQEGDFKYVW